MFAKYAVAAISGLALASAQGAPPPPGTLTTTMSGVLPVLPTPFSGIETEEGAITYDGNPVVGFTGPGGNATVQSGLPQATYQAVLPTTNFDNLTGSTITGTVTAMTGANGVGVDFSVNLMGFPSEAAYGPFVYHVHQLPVPADGNCSATMGHLDPTDRGELYACEVQAPQTCQAGDLAGKHGNITTPTFMANYTDPYLSTDPSSPYYFGGLALVIHSSNTTRLTCANFLQVSGSTSGINSSSSSSPSSASGVAGSSSTAAATSTGSIGGGAGGASSTASASATPATYTGAAVPVSVSGAAGAFSGVFALIVSFLL